MASQVTVIVPAYNAERCIERAVKSLLAQTMPVDIIVVNDGSTDRTAEIAKRLGVTVIDQKNAGAYTARVVGANAATTPYVGFLDADDYVRPDMYARLLDFAKGNDLDISQCDYSGKGVTCPTAHEELFLNEQDIREKVILPRFVRGEDAVHVWDKLYCCDLVRNFEPSSIMMFDDLVFNAQAFARAKRIGYLHEVLYDYEVNAGSSVRNFRLRNVEDLKEAIYFRKQYYVKYGIAADDNAHAQWIVRNVRNMYVVACSAPIRDGVPRKDKIDALLDMTETRDAFGACGLTRRWRMMHNSLVILAVGILKRMKTACYK